MPSQCSCGEPILRSSDALGCIECGGACCPGCAVVMESAWYCANCADALLAVG